MTAFAGVYLPRVRHKHFCAHSGQDGFWVVLFTFYEGTCLTADNNNQAASDDDICKAVWVSDDYLPGESEIACKDFPITRWASTWKADRIHAVLIDGPYGKKVCLWDGHYCVARKRPEDFDDLSWLGWRGVTLRVVDDNRQRLCDQDAKAAVFSRYVTLGIEDVRAISSWVRWHTDYSSGCPGGKSDHPHIQVQETKDTHPDESPIGLLVMEVCHALKAGCYLAALWTALSLPDICSQAEGTDGGKKYPSYADGTTSGCRLAGKSLRTANLE